MLRTVMQSALKEKKSYKKLKSDIFEIEQITEKEMHPKKGSYDEKNSPQEGNVAECSDSNFLAHEASPKPVFFMHRHHKGKNVPTLSVEGLALETLLRSMSVCYKSVENVKNSYSPVYINHESLQITGLKKIMLYIKVKLALDPDEHCTPEFKKQIRAYSSMILDQTTFILNYYRWYSDYDSWKDQCQEHLKKGTLKKFNSRKKYGSIIKNQMESLAIYHWSEKGMRILGQEDLDTLSSYLGDKLYFGPNRICSLDCLTFGLVANILYSDVSSPLQDHLKASCENLVRHAERVKNDCWKDWAECLLPKKKDKHEDLRPIENPKPRTKKNFRFSFQKCAKNSNAKGEKSAPKTAREGSNIDEIVSIKVETKDNKTFSIKDEEQEIKELYVQKNEPDEKEASPIDNFEENPSLKNVMDHKEEGNYFKENIEIVE